MPSLGCWLVDYGLDCVENKLLVDYLGLIIFRSSLQYKFGKQISGNLVFFPLNEV